MPKIILANPLTDTTLIRYLIHIHRIKHPKENAAMTATQLKESLRQQIIAFVVAAAPSKSKSENAKTIAQIFDAVKSAAAFGDDNFSNRFSTPALRAQAADFVRQYEAFLEAQAQESEADLEERNYRYDWETSDDHPRPRPQKRRATYSQPRRQTVGLHPSDYCGGLGA